MQDVKKKILLASASSVVLATIMGIGTALLANTPELAARWTAVSSILGIGSIGLFFVGIVFPKE